MPRGMNGRELANEASRRRPGIRVVYTSGYTASAFTEENRPDEGPDLPQKPCGGRKSPVPFAPRWIARNLGAEASPRPQPGRWRERAGLAGAGEGSLLQMPPSDSTLGSGSRLSGGCRLEP